MTDIITQLEQILRNDVEANAMLNDLNRVSKNAGLTEEQYRQVRGTLLMACVKNNAECMKVYSDYVYNAINGAN